MQCFSCLQGYTVGGGVGSDSSCTRALLQHSIFRDGMDPGLRRDDGAHHDRARGALLSNRYTVAAQTCGTWQGFETTIVGAPCRRDYSWMSIRGEAPLPPGWIACAERSYAIRRARARKKGQIPVFPNISRN